MQCILRPMMALALIMFSAVTYAQQNFFTNTNTPSAPTSTSAKTPGGTRAPVMTPEQFKQSIDKISQQTDKNITDQLDKKIIKTPPLPPAPPAAPTDNSSNFSIENPQPSQPAQISQPPAYGAQQPAQIQPVPGQRPPAPVPGTTPPNSTLQPAAPAQGGYYPGFGTGKGNTPGGNTSGGNRNQNGGWNIQY
ncbi:MAG: hypothetical protein M1270_06905 [Gammaproteobacteria bacterium]|nr:hypothetical protein [Gammaproteobacteria bacterium]